MASVGNTRRGRCSFCRLVDGVVFVSQRQTDVAICDDCAHWAAAEISNHEEALERLDEEEAPGGR